MSGQGRIVDEIIARIARGQHGVVARRQLLSAGIAVHFIDRRVARGLLVSVFPGVYRVGHEAPSIEARYMAAVLACGEGALLCGRAAAYLWGLIKGNPPPPEVLCPTQRRIRGIKTHRSRKPDSADATKHRAIPTTTVARTLVDLAGVMSADDLARACHEAGVRYRTTPAQTAAVLSRRPTAKGAGNLRRVMSGDERVALSRLEARFLELLRGNALPLPRTNRPAGGRRVDCRWPDHRLTVELDSYRYHGSRRAWEGDRRREREAYARGDDFRRYTWGDVIEHPAPMLGELRRLLPAAPTLRFAPRPGPPRGRGTGSAT